jgi:PAS domain S-box-containing protein
MAEPDAAHGPISVAVLIVDDRAENRAALRALLPTAEYRVVEASSGPEALRKLLDEEFAVLLIDVLMPGMDGFELAAAVRERERTAAVPIVFLTGQAVEAENLHKAYQVGGVDFLIKPLVSNMVAAKVAVFAELFRQRKRIEHQAAMLVEAERRETELRLIETGLASERRYRALAEAIPHIVWTARPDGQIDYFNQRWFEYTGLSQADTAGSWVAALHPDDLARCQQMWQEALASGLKQAVECRLLGRDATYRWQLCRAVPERGTTGPILSWLGTFTDIEDQKRAEEFLAEFKGTLDAVLDAVLIFHPNDWRFQYTNQGASALLGYSADELGRMRPVDVLVDYDEAAFRELLAPLNDGSRTVLTLEAQFRRRDYRTVPVEMSLQLIRTDGGRLVAIARDITERKRAQLERELLYREAVDAVRTRDEFLSVASHELKSPIAALHLQVDSILRARARGKGPLTPEQMAAKLDVVARQTARLARMIDELMDVSRIAAKRLRLDIEEVDLSAIVRDVASRHAEEAARAGSALEVRADAPVVGRWDRIRLEQVVTNLLTNAVKFGAGRPIELAVEGQGPEVRLTVADHGIGIAPEDVERIFQRYEQAVTSRTYGGLGLGLYIVHQIVEAHGGTIRVESQSGAGTRFTVDLPREVTKPAVPADHDDDAATAGDESGWDS